MSRYHNKQLAHIMLKIFLGTKKLYMNDHSILLENRTNWPFCSIQFIPGNVCGLVTMIMYSQRWYNHFEATQPWLHIIHQTRFGIHMFSILTQFIC
jgi:hypothetical protein